MSYTFSLLELMLILGTAMVATWTVTRTLMQQNHEHHVKTICTLCENNRKRSPKPLEEVLHDI